MRKIIEKVKSWRDKTPVQTGKDKTGAWLLIISAGLLAALAAAQGLVSYIAQYHFIFARKHDVFASTLEALGLDCAAVILALLAIANARLGRKAVTERIMAIAAVAASMVMNVAGSDGSPTSVMVYALPAVLYAASSDRLIAVVRHRYLARIVEVVAEPTEPTVVTEVVTIGCGCEVGYNIETAALAAARHKKEHRNEPVSPEWLVQNFKLPLASAKNLLQHAGIEAVA